MDTHDTCWEPWPSWLIVKIFERIEIPVESPYVLRALKPLFEEGSFDFYDSDLHEDRETYLPLEFQQAVASLERAAQFERDLEDREHGIVVSIRTEGVKIDQVNEPVENTRS